MAIAIASSFTHSISNSTISSSPCLSFLRPLHCHQKSNFVALPCKIPHGKFVVKCSSSDPLNARYFS